MLSYELTPKKGKSFGRRAFVTEFDNGSRFLMSYGTTICAIDSSRTFRRIWEGYSATTMKHVNAFRDKFGLTPITKDEWLSLYYEE